MASTNQNLMAAQRFATSKKWSQDEFPAICRIWPRCSDEHNLVSIQETLKKRGQKHSIRLVILEGPVCERVAAGIKDFLLYKINECDTVEVEFIKSFPGTDQAANILREALEGKRVKKVSFFTAAHKGERKLIDMTMRYSRCEEICFDQCYFDGSFSLKELPSSCRSLSISWPVPLRWAVIGGESSGLFLRVPIALDQTTYTFSLQNSGLIDIVRSKQCSLEHLKLDASCIDDSCLVALFQAIQQNTTLKSLALNLFDTSQNIEEAFTTCIERSSTLQAVDIWPVPLSFNARQVDRLRVALSSTNSHLKRFQCGICPMVVKQLVVRNWAGRNALSMQDDRLPCGLWPLILCRASPQGVRRAHGVGPQHALSMSADAVYSLIRHGEMLYSHGKL